MKIFLRIRAWQLFPILVIPFVGPHILLASGVGAQQVFRLMPYGMVFGLAIFIGWFWTLGIRLNKRTEETLRPPSGLFNFAMAYVPLYFFLLVTLSQWAPRGTAGRIIISFIFQVRLLVLIFMFYGGHFVAKNLAIVEKRRQVQFSDYAGSFFLLWFWPIGIWIIQPRINKIFEEDYVGPT